MGLDLSSTKAVLLPVAMAGLLGGGLLLAGPSTGPSVRPSGETSAPAAPRTVGKKADRNRDPGASPLGTAAPSTAKLTHVVHAGWGNKLGELGHEIPLEAAPLGPTSFIVDEAGTIHVLDAVNSRVMVFERGKGTRSVALAQDTFQDIDFRPASQGGGYVLLDPFTAGSLAFTDDKGRIRHEVPLVGEGVAETGLVTGVFVRPEGTWVEVGHDYLVMLADETGAPVPQRRRAEGRFVGAGDTTIEAMAQKPYGAAIVRHERGDVTGSLLVQTSFALPLLSLTGVEGSPDGSVTLGVRLHEDELTAPFAIKRTEHWLVTYDAKGQERDRLLVPEPDGPEETFREMKAGRDGKMYAWTFTSQGVDIYRREP